MKIGIVSSFDILCGNATYSEVIARGLESYGTVVKIPLALALRDNFDKKEVNHLCKEIASCDVVNFQMELGLYGPTPTIASQVVCRLIRYSRRASITMHRVEQKPKNIMRTMYNALKAVKFWTALSVLKDFLIKRNIFNAYKKIILTGVQKNVTFICHTYREEKRIKKIEPKANCVVYPIVWPDNDHLQKINISHLFLKKFPVIGLFGFVSRYKNYELVFEALKNEPYSILIAGGTHPESQEYGRPTQGSGSHSYMRTLSSQVSDKAFEGRVFHLISLSDDELVSLMKSVDLVCLPYAETGQSGSGIASLAIQFGTKVIFSDNACFNELTQFLDKKPIFFDVDSPKTLMDAIKLSFRHPPSKFKDHSFPSMVQTYFSAMNSK